MDPFTRNDKKYKQTLFRLSTILSSWKFYRSKLSTRPFAPIGRPATRDVTTQASQIVRSVQMAGWKVYSNSILMCKNAEIPFIYYDLETCSVTYLSVDERSPFANHRLPMPAKNQCSNIIMYKNFFPLTPSMILFNDLIPFHPTLFQSLQDFGM